MNISQPQLISQTTVNVRKLIKIKQTGMKAGNLRRIMIETVLNAIAVMYVPV